MASTFVQLRALLDKTERDAVTMRHEPGLAAPVVQAVEQAAALLSELRTQGVDVRAEEGRADSLRGRVLREARLVQRLVAQSGTGAVLADSALWREIGASEAARVARSRRNLLLAGGGIALVALLLFALLRLFPAPPTANIIAVGQLFAQGDVQGALARAKAEQAAAPDDRQIGLWVAALEQQLGQQQAAAAWAAAEQRYPNKIDYLSDKAIVLLSVNDVAGAEQTATQLQHIPGGEAIGLFHLGAVREGQQRYTDAIQLYQQAAAKADAQNRPELAVTARTRMATLMQTPR